MFDPVAMNMLVITGNFTLEQGGGAGYMSHHCNERFELLTYLLNMNSNVSPIGMSLPDFTGALPVTRIGFCHCH